jgi:hypothetical protein
VNRELQVFYRGPDFQHDFADVFARFHQVVRCGRLFEWKYSIDRGLKAPSDNQRPDVPFNIRGERCFERTLP